MHSGWILLRQYTHLFGGFENVAAEKVAGCVSGDVTEDFQVLRVMRHVKDPGEKKKEKTK
jgi:hypothetical protein